LKRTFGYFSPGCLLLLCAPFVHAQATVDIHAGVSGVTAKSTGETIDTFGDGVLHQTPSLDGVLMNFGAGFMLSPRFGVGAELAFKPRQSDYAGLGYRPLFWDFNGIYHPHPSSKRVVPELQAGLGAVNLKFYYNQKDCNVFAGCASSNVLVQSSNHFQLHAGGGVKFFVTDHVYVQPKFDLHWVNNFFQFGRNLVPQYGVSVGYKLGD